VTSFDCDYVVITGGEPLLQQGEVFELLQCIKAARPDWRLEIETNGTIVPTPEIEELVEQFNVSPKLASSGNAIPSCQKPTPLAHFARSLKTTFKFVVTDPSDLSEVVGLVDGYGINPRKVYLVPEAINKKDANRKSSWLPERCKELGYAYCDRLNIALYGNQRAT
jgi:7-carboxy-7-deazaguanine synthase